MAALAVQSSHPLSVAIESFNSECVKKKNREFGSDIALSKVKEFKHESGMGVCGIVDEHLVLVGNIKLLQHYNVEVDDENEQRFYNWSSDGYTVIFAAIDNKVRKCSVHLSYCVVIGNR